MSSFLEKLSKYLTIDVELSLFDMFNRQQFDKAKF